MGELVRGGWELFEKLLQKLEGALRKGKADTVGGVYRPNRDAPAQAIALRLSPQADNK